MHFAAYHFDGDPDQLQVGYDQLMSTLPPDEVLLNISVAREDGITVYDTCLTASDFEAFSTSADFAAALEAAGLPTPRVEPIGQVRATHGTTLVGAH